MAQRLSGSGKEMHRLLKTAGIKVIDFGLTGRNHIRFVLERPDGVRRKLICSNTPSDWRSSRNTLALARRWQAWASASTN